jgi:hypothetical protein
MTMWLHGMATAGLLAVWLAAVCAQAQEPPLLNQAVQNNWMQFSIASGRVTLDGTRVGNIQSNNSDSNGRREQLSVRNDNGEPAMTYERTSANESLLFDLTSGDRVRIRRTPKGAGSIVPMEFVQIPNEKIVLTLGPADHQQAYQAASLWHLLIAQPQPCKQHLIPVLEMLRPDWKLAETAAKVEQRLLQGVGGDVAAQRSRWAAWVAQLGDDRFAKREAADRALRAADPSVLSYLRQIEFGRLDAEQQFRVRRIIDALSGQSSDDAPEQVAATLSGDPLVWLALLGRPELSTRQTAARQLAVLLGEPIGVDPAADPATQQTQREQLRARIEGK